MSTSAAEDDKAPAWRVLLHGQNLDGWSVIDYAGGGEVEADDDGHIVLQMGQSLTGIRFNATNTVPVMDYEIALEAMKLAGSDFFCGLTFPVGPSAATLILGGWGGGVIGISSIDNFDASENDTTEYRPFEANHWYKIRLRVTPERIQAWIDEDQIVDQNISGRRISMRPGDIEYSAPLGISTYQTTAAVRNVRIRPLSKAKKIVLIAGSPDGHAPGTHEYEKGIRILERCLKSAGMADIEVETYTGDWPENPRVLDSAATIVLYMTGSDKGKHPLLQKDRLKHIEFLMERGTGLVALHYTLYLDNQPGGGGPEFLEWIGGYNDYQNRYSTHRVTEENPPAAEQLSPAHPISRGWKTFTTKNEFYIRQRFRENDARLTPILGTLLPVDQPEKQVIAWALEREDGGRGFGFTGGHFHSNWFQDDFRTMVLNAIVWTAKGEVPADGVNCSPPQE